MISTSSTRLTASAIVHTGPCYLTGIIVESDLTNTATISVYDYLSAGGTEVARIVSKTPIVASFAHPRKCAIGIYVAISGTAAACEVHYSIG